MISCHVTYACGVVYFLSVMLSALLDFFLLLSITYDHVGQVKGKIAINLLIFLILLDSAFFEISKANGISGLKSAVLVHFILMQL